MIASDCFLFFLFSLPDRYFFCEKRMQHILKGKYGHSTSKSYSKTPKIRAITTQSKLMLLFIFLRSPERRRFSTRNTQRNGDQPPSNPQMENQTPNIGKLQHILRNHASAVMIL